MDINPKNIDFIDLYRHDDIRRLAFLGDRYPDVDLTWSLEQIAGWQTACRKLPTWAATTGLVYPPHLSMEQCSSEVTACYKRAIMDSVMADHDKAKISQQHPSGAGWQLVDLTGGFGVDFSFMAPLFEQAIYVEQQAALCETARHNFPLLGLSHAKVVCGDSTEQLNALTPHEHRVIFLDPARRDRHGSRTYALGDCTPDVLQLREKLLEKSEWLLLKLSPMLDWHKAVADLEDGDVADGLHTVRQIHIVSVQNECKELLLLLSRKHRGCQQVCCTNDGQTFAFDPKEAATIREQFSDFSDKGGNDWNGQYLYEPNASVMKAGCFALLQQRYNVVAIGANSHLFISPDEIDDFPGRRFVIQAVFTMNKKDMKQELSGVERANIAVRNFPLSAPELRKKLHLSDGGNIYIFATTTAQRNHLLLLCKKG